MCWPFLHFSAQIGKVLAKLQLTSPTNYKSEDKLKLLRCSMVFHKYLSEYEDENIFALFDNSGQFMDFKTVYGEVTGIFAKSTAVICYIPVMSVLLKSQIN